MKNRKLTEDFVKNSVIKWLSKNGYGYFQFDELHTHGVDIRARNTRYSRYFYVEAKGEGINRSSHEVGFIYSLGQIITRMKDTKTTRNYYGLALPERSAAIALRRLPWQVANKLHLYIFSVSPGGSVKRYSSKELKKYQTK